MCHDDALIERPAGVIFDLDGTLIDSVGVFRTAINEIFRRVDLPPVPQEKVIHIMQSGLSPWDILVPDHIADRDDLIKRCLAIDKEIFPRLYLETARLFPGTRYTLEFLSQKGIKMGIVSSSFQVEDEIEKFLHKEDVDRYMDSIVMRPDAPRPKPAPDPLLLCLKELKTNPASSVYVGDTPNDVRAGKAAGTKTVAVLSGVGTFEDLSQVNPDWLVQGVEELPKLFSPDL